MDIVFVVAERAVNQTGTARYPFRLSPATDGVTYQVEAAEPEFAVESRVRPPGSAEPLTYELEVGPRNGRRMRPGEHHLVLMATAPTSDDTATAGFVLRVEPCVHVEDPTFSVDWINDVATLTLGLSSRCFCGLKCSVDVSYHHCTGSKGEIDLTVGAGPVKVDVPFPLCGQKDFDAHDVQISVRSDDGTVVSWRPGDTPTVTWSPPPRPPSVRPNNARRRSRRRGARRGYRSGRPPHPLQWGHERETTRRHVVLLVSPDNERREPHRRQSLVVVVAEPGKQVREAHADSDRHRGRCRDTYRRRQVPE